MVSLKPCFPRCQASVIAVSTCIALMMQHTESGVNSEGKIKPLCVNSLIEKCYKLASTVLETDEHVRN